MVVCLLLLWKRSRCVHCVVMRIGTTSSEIFGICLSILYHAFYRKSIVRSAKESIPELCKMMEAIRGIIVTKVTFDNVCTHPKAYAWVRSAARRWMGRTAKPPAGMGLPVGRLADPFVFSACRLFAYGIGRQPFAGVRALSFTAAAYPAGICPSTTGRLPLPPPVCRSRSRCRRRLRPLDPCR